ncbi:MAG: metallophosphoesterase [Desulfobacteraceae bacterium]|nr:metallophosphoesterase [Desulfobacteraceae bacterium]MBC2757463.1 metallophosphoesterase [Desulfobacteraceae bacterium]
MKTIWLTDIHLEFLNDPAFDHFMRELCDKNADAILISGDIAQAPTLERYLLKMAQSLAIPIYFVLGNHDYYHGSISGVRSAVTRLLEKSTHLHWLNVSGAVYLSPTTCLVGHDGWCDARFGDYYHSSVMLNDFLLIFELSALSRGELLQQLNRLGDEAAEHFKIVLPEALKSAEHVVVLTHVPPFLEAAWYNGKYCESDWLPFFSCKAVGDILTEIMKKYQDKRMTVLCGHTHGGGMSQILPNLVALTGQARYGHPGIQETFEWF